MIAVLGAETVLRKMPSLPTALSRCMLDISLAQAASGVFKACVQVSSLDLMP